MYKRQSIACIDKMKKLNTPKMFREMGTKLTEGFKAAGKEHGFDPVSYTHLDVYKRQALPPRCFSKMFLTPERLKLCADELIVVTGRCFNTECACGLAVYDLSLIHI